MTQVEMQEELKQLKKANIKQDGTIRKGAVPQELARISELTGLLEKEGPEKAERGLGSVTADMPQTKTRVDESASETPEEEVIRLKKEISQMQKQQARSAGANKIKVAGKKVGYVPRPDEIMEEALDDAERRDPEDWDDSNRLAVERTIRRYVRKGGSVRDRRTDKYHQIPAGFSKGLSLFDRCYALKLLEMMGRLTKPFEEIKALLVEQDKLTPAKQRQTGEEFNTKLEELGVCWDETFQVPGMSEQLKG